MDIRVTVTAVLEDSSWGFSDFLGDRSLNESAMLDIRKLIDADPYVIIEKGSWVIDKV